MALYNGKHHTLLNLSKYIIATIKYGGKITAVFVYTKIEKCAFKPCFLILFSHTVLSKCKLATEK